MFFFIISAQKIDRFWPGNEKYMKETIEGLISINIARPPKSFYQFEKRLRHFVINLLPTDSDFSDLTADDRNLTIGVSLQYIKKYITQHANLFIHYVGRVTIMSW